MRKRWYILFVARDAEGQLRKIPIPVHYLYVFLAGALIGMVANVLDHVSEMSAEQLAHILDESFVHFVNGFGNRA